MKLLTAIIIVTAGLANGQGSSYLQIAMTADQYTNAAVRNGVGGMLVDFSIDADTPANREKWMTGWDSGYTRSANTNQTIYVATVSVLQGKRELRSTLTPAEMTRYKNAIATNPKIKASLNRSPAASLAAWGIIRKAGQ